MRTPVRVAATLVVLFASYFALLGPTPVAAEQPTRVVTALSRDGVFVHNSRDDNIDRDKLIAIVEEADRLGYKMAVVIPLDPLPELRSFVLRVQQGGEYDAVLGFGNDGEIEAETADELGSARLGALRAVRTAEGSTEELTAMFLTELTTETSAEIPPFVWRVVRWTALLLVGLVGVGLLELAWRHFSKRGRAPSV